MTDRNVERVAIIGAGDLGATLARNYIQKIMSESSLYSFLMTILVNGIYVFMIYLFLVTLG